MRCVVTGGSGYVGHHLVRRLAGAGHTVRVLDVHDDPARPPGVDFVEGDVRSRTAVARALGGSTVVVHTAALVPLTKARRAFESVNVDGTRIVAEEAGRAGVRHVVHLSSSAVYGAHPGGLVDARTPLRPAEPYGWSKLQAENAVRAACEASGTACTIIRPRTLLGPGRLGIFAMLFRWVHAGRPVWILGDGSRPFQFLHVDDLIDVVQLSVAGAHTGVFNVGTDRYGPLRDALEGLIAHAGSRSRVRRLPARPAMVGLALLDRLGLSPLAPWHYRTYHQSVCFDLEPLTALGWQARHSNDDMLREAYDSFVDQTDAHREDRASPHRRPPRPGLLRLLERPTSRHSR